MQISVNKELNRNERFFYFIAALFLNITLVTDLLRGINAGWFEFPAESIETLKIVIYVLIFIYVIFRIFKNPTPKVLFYGSLFFVVVICASILVMPEILIILPTFSLLFFSRCLPGFYIAYSINNYQYLFDSMKIYVWIGLIYALLMVTGIRGVESVVYMSFGYNLLLPSLVAIISGFFYRKYYLILGIFLTLCIIGFGGRGALICLLTTLILLFYLTSNYLQTYKKFIINILAIFSIAVIIVKYNAILQFLMSLFPDSRTLLLLFTSNFTSDSGRFSYYSESLRLIHEAPFAFRGILSDRILIASQFGNIEQAFGSYAHNIFLEIFVQFGIVFGGILLTGLFFLLVKSILIVLRSKDIYLKIIFSIFVGSYCIQLLFSGSYVSTPMSWVALGLIVSIISRDKYKILLAGRSSSHVLPPSRGLPPT